jgi:hypothetical protein
MKVPSSTHMTDLTPSKRNRRPIFSFYFQIFKVSYIFFAPAWLWGEDRAPSGEFGILNICCNVKIGNLPIYLCYLLPREKIHDLKRSAISQKNVWLLSTLTKNFVSLKKLFTMLNFALFRDKFYIICDYIFIEQCGTKSQVIQQSKVLRDRVGSGTMGAVKQRSSEVLVCHTAGQ